MVLAQKASHFCSMKIRLFTSGTHNGLTFSNEEVNAIHRKSYAASGKVPFVIGHPKNDLPIVGWLPKSAISIYGEGDKMSIGFEKGKAEFSEESIDALKKLKRDKISVRLTNGEITHIGLVESAAVAENNEQQFSAESKTGVLCFSEDFVFEEAEAAPNWFKKFSEKFFNNKTTQTTMATENEIKLQAEIDALKTKISDFENKDKKAAADAEVEALKKKIADFESKEKDTLKAELKTKIEGLKLSAEDAKKQSDFGNSLIDQDVSLAKVWMESLKPVQVAANVTQGSVTEGAAQEDFAAKKDVRHAAEADAKAQFEKLKTNN